MAWQQVIRPMLTDYAGDAWFISTPKGFDDFWTLWRWGQVGDEAYKPEWKSWRRPSSENPYIPRDDLAQAQRDLPSVVWRQEYLAEFLAGGIGQFFDEWDPAIHICRTFEIPRAWRRYGMLDYGYNPDPFCYLQFAVSREKQVFVYREIYRHRVQDSEQALLIAAACRDDVSESIVAGRDLWNSSGKACWAGVPPRPINSSGRPRDSTHVSFPPT